MKAITLPDSIRQFVKEQVTIEIPPDDPVFPYSEYWWKAVVFMLLSGRIKSTYNRNLPNLTDVNRVCKEGNFNLYYFRIHAEFLIASEVLNATSDDRYVPGKRFEDFLSRNLTRIKEVAHHGLVSAIGGIISSQSSRPKLVVYDGAVTFLQRFFMALDGKSLRAERIGQAFRDFSMLPENESARVWLDATAEKALIDAIFICGWAYQVKKKGEEWFYLNHTGRVMLGFEEPPQIPEESKDLKVMPDLSILAGIDLPVETLATLFRYCRIKLIRPIVTFQLDAKVMATVPRTTPAVEELSRILEQCSPLPSAVAVFLNKENRQGGEVQYLSCQGLIRVEDMEVLKRIKAHPKLKSYLAQGGPQGYLIIKDGTNLFNFLQRCEDHGFEVKPMQFR